jgi:predicted nucleic acid-binding Zn ribbon protein
MIQLNKILRTVLKNAGLEKGVTQNTALIIWDSVVGKKIAEQTNPEKVKYGVLTVKASTPAWRQELLFKKQDILKKLNKKLGSKVIKDIRFL